MDVSRSFGESGPRQFARRVSRRDPEVMLLLALVAYERDVPLQMLFARSRCRAEVAEARCLAMYLAHVSLGRPIHTLARLFRRHWSTVSRACARLEDRREYPEVDAFLDRLESKVLASIAETRRRGKRRVSH